MMTFLLNEEQTMLGDSARTFLGEQSPVAVQRRLRDAGEPLAFDPQLWAQVVDLGWTAAAFPEAHGGLAVGYAGVGAVFEQMGRHLAALPLLSTILCGELLLRGGADTPAAERLPQLVAGATRMALALDEGSRHDPRGLAAQARQEGDGWVLDADKRYVIDGVGADAYIVAARIGGAADTDDLGLFLVDAAAAGLKASALRLADSRNHARVVLEGVRVPGTALLARGRAASGALDTALDRARACLAAEALGLVRESFERTVAYLKERVQFDVPIGSFQALQHRAARLYVQIELLDSAVRAALAAIDAGRRDAALLVSLAKAHASDLCERVLNEAVQMHGGIGVTDEFDLGLFLKRARVLQLCLGDARFHRERYATLRGF